MGIALTGLGSGTLLATSIDWGARLPTALFAAAPALFVLFAIDRLDARGDEPRWLLRRAAVMGGAVVVPVLVVELLLAFAGVPVRGGDAVAIALSSVVLVAIPEEAGKAFVLMGLLARRLELEHRRDGIRYGARIGLGFAIVENAWYGLAYADASGIGTMLVARTILTVPMHAVWASLAADAIARRRIDGAGPGLAGGIAIAAAAHAVFDFGLGIAGLAQARDDQLGFGAAVALVLAVVALSVLALRRRVNAATLRDAEDEHAMGG